ncbi:D-alanyl-D-alanine carboxypeptidase, partial [Aphanothece microscopica]|uniref:D-alanyl-D-alanine carboxypeptidase n=1 Tax=Aphanothece microscopica TaxID=1049561 RepID=UPI003984D880
MLDRWAEVLDSIGVRSIKGTIIGDDDLFDEERYAAGWSWDDFLYAYAPQVSALSIADNAVEIQIIPPRNSDLRPSIRVIPENDYVRVVSALRFVDSTGITDIKPKREEHSTVIDITGTYALTSRSDTISLKLSVDNPTLYFAHLLKAAIVRRG